MSMPAIIGAPHSVALVITNKCNLRCLHCFNNSGENDVVANELSDNEVLELVDSICQMHPFSFCFCGGETLLRKDLVIESLRRLSASGVKCNLVSNGLLANSNTVLPDDFSLSRSIVQTGLKSSTLNDVGQKAIERCSEVSFSVISMASSTRSYNPESPRICS